jgi:hypothetical protein
MFSKSGMIQCNYMCRVSIGYWSTHLQSEASVLPGKTHVRVNSTIPTGPRAFPKLLTIISNAWIKIHHSDLLANSIKCFPLQISKAMRTFSTPYNIKSISTNGMSIWNEWFANKPTSLHFSVSSDAHKV